MRLTKGSTRDATFVGLASGNEVAHTAGELIGLLTAVQEVEDVSHNEGAVDPSHVHLTVDVDSHSSRHCAQDIRSSSVFEGLASYFVFIEPVVVRADGLKGLVSVVLQRDKVVQHLLSVNDIVSLLRSYVHNSEYRRVCRSEMALNPRSSSEPSLRAIVTLPQVRAHPGLVVTWKLHGSFMVNISGLESVGHPVQEPRLSRVLASHACR